MTDKKGLSKLKQYIHDDRPRKLKSFVKKKKIDLQSIEMKRCRNILHYCCKHGSGTVMRYLLSEGVSASHQDDDLKCPLHVALERALKLEQARLHDEVTDCYTELIMPLLERCPACLDMENSGGQSCRQLLHELVQRRESADPFHHQTRKDSSPEPGDLDEQEWRDKLADEFQHEYYSNFGRYEPDLTWNSHEEETCGDWADRIREEYRAKKRAQERAYYSSANGKNGHKGSKQNGSNDSQGATGSDSKKYKGETLKEARERMRKQFDSNKAKDLVIEILKKRMKYEERYQTLLRDGTKKTLKYDDIPWPSVKAENFDLEVLFDKMDKVSSEYKKYLRDQQIRWHPDKFLQRFGHCLDDGEKDKIMKRVTNLSQSLNKLKT